MNNPVSSATIEKWLKGWSLSRELTMPVKFKSGFRVDVGYEEQKARYVFCEPNNDFIELLKIIEQPWIFLKLCASSTEIEHLKPSRWTIQPEKFIMSCCHLMNNPIDSMPDQYKLAFEHYNSTFVVKIMTRIGELASIGRVVLVDDLAVYDRISTDIRHRKKGLARVLLKQLEDIALSNGVFKNILIATEEGKSLYKSLGWEINSPYTSLVIFP